MLPFNQGIIIPGFNEQEYKKAWYSKRYLFWKNWLNW